MKTPSYAVLDGIIAATSLYLAGPPDSGLENDPEQERETARVQAADTWARTMRDEKQEKAGRRSAGLPPVSHR